MMMKTTKMTRNFKNYLYMEKKLVCDVPIAILFYLNCQDLNSETDTTFFFIFMKKKNKALCGFNHPQLFFLKKLHSLSSEDQANQNFSRYIWKKGSMCQQYLRIWYKKNLDSHIWTCLLTKVNSR
jgi:hypothetical protein